MATRQQAMKVAAELGATITPEESFDGINYWMEAEAPDGKEWSNGGSVTLVARYWPTQDKNSKSEAYADLIERMKFGVEAVQD